MKIFNKILKRKKLINDAYNQRLNEINKTVNILINNIDYYIFDEVLYRLKYSEFKTLITININTRKRLFNIGFINNDLSLHDLIKRRDLTNDLDISNIYDSFSSEFNTYITNFCYIYNFDLDIHKISENIIYDIKLKENDNED